MKNKTQKLPPEVYYLVLNGAKQYFKNKEDAEEMARKLYEDGTNPGGIYTENDPDEIQDLYDAGYFHEGDDKLDHEVVNDKSLDAIKDNFTPPSAEDEEEYYEDDGGRVYTWGELKKDIDDWVKKPDFGEQFANEDERKGYFNSDSTPNYRKIYKDFWDIGSNGAMSQISKDRAKELRDDIDTNDNGKIEVDEMADFQKSLDDYSAKNKKGRDDIPVTTRR